MRKACLDIMISICENYYAKNKNIDKQQEMPYDVYIKVEKERLL